MATQIFPSIPASAIVTVNPSVISAGGTGLSMQALMLTNGTRVPIGTVPSFPSLAAVTSYFGPTSVEAIAAAIYFAGFTGSQIKPSSVLFAQYPTAAVGAFLRGGNLSALTLTQLQAISGVLSLTVNGTLYTSSAISLAAASSFSNAATIIQAAFSSPPFNVTYDSVSGAFIFTSTVTGSASTITVASGTASAALYLTTATGAVTSQGSNVATPAAFMATLITQTTNFAAFLTLFNPDASGNANKYAFAVWNGQQNNQFAYLCADTDVTPTLSNAATGSLGYLLAQAGVSGTSPIYDPLNSGLAPFIAGAIASINFGGTNQALTLAFKNQSGINPSVTNQLVGANLMANGYSFYGAYATASQGFQFFYNGNVSGPFLWLDAYVEQIWLNSALQLALMTLLTSVPSVPYDTLGYSLIRAACLGPIQQALTFGMFAPGIPLSPLQIAEVNAAAGTPIDATLASQGWYLQILPATAQQRANRTSPPMTFWYVTPGAVQSITLASVAVQ